MNYFLRIGAYLLHPMLMPLLGAFLYYIVTPRFLEPQLIRAKLFAIVIVTILIPIITFFLLKNLRLVESIHLKNVAERKLPLMIQCVLLLLIVRIVYDPYESPELYYFFVGVLFTALTALILVFLKFKVSLHQMAIAGVTIFLIGLSAHFQINMLLWIAFCFFCNGWVASSRLFTNSHTYPELVAGFVIGALPQLILFNFWL